MDTIRTFLDNLFSTLPQRKDVLKAKEELYASMVEKYQAHKSAGKTENEAIGLVIADFGNIDELLEELGIDAKKEDVTVIIDKQQCDEMIAAKRIYGRFIGLGVLLILVGIAISASMKNILSLIGITGQVELVQALVFFLMVFIAVGLFVFSGLSLSNVNKPFEADFRLDQSARKAMEKESESYRRTHQISVFLGVMTILASIFFFVASSYVDQARSVLASIGFVVIGLGVYLLVSSGVPMGGYNQALKRGDYSEAGKENERVTGIVAGIVFPVAVIVYLLTSFLTGRWDITWIIWPVVGIGFGIFAATYEEINKNKKNKR
ncbi:MAG: permease prefix domain 1-containing protein [Acholeplasmataceae bacterium]